MFFIKQIAECYNKIGVTNHSYDHILSDITSGEISTYKEAAAKYYKGNEQSMYKTADRIKQDFYRDTLDLDSYHNDSQRVLNKLRIQSTSVHRLLSMGFRKVAIQSAIQTYKAAKKYHYFLIACDMASVLSQHYGQHLGNESLCEEWNIRWIESNKQVYITQEAKYKFTIAACRLRNNKSNDANSVSKLKEVIDSLKQYSDDAESYSYWNYYFLLRIFYHELKHEYNLMLEVALESYGYFNTLFLDHRSARLAMVANVIHAHNLMHNYSEAIRFASMVKELEDAGTNKDLAYLRLAKSYINLDDTERALQLLLNISGSLGDVEEKIDLYISICNQQVPKAPDKSDADGMDIAHKIATLYSDLAHGITDRYTHNYILKYIRRHNIQNTREGLVLKIFSIMRYRGFDDKRFSKYQSLREQLQSTAATLTEIEILQYEKMLDKIDTLYS